MTVCAYLTKKKKNKTYYSGRLIIPSRFCESSKLIKENYGLFELTKTHLSTKKNALWGFSYLLFIPVINQPASPPVVFKTQTSYCKRLRKKYSKIHPHTRKSFNKYYTAGKIYLPEKLINKKIYFIRLDNVIIRSVTKNKKSKTTHKIEKGMGYVLFYESSEARMQIQQKTLFGKQLSYGYTLELLDKRKTIIQIAKIREIKQDTVWAHIVQGLKHNEISTNELIEIIKMNCNQEIRDKVLTLLFSIRYSSNRLEYYKWKKSKRRENPRLSLSVKEFKKLFTQKYGQHLPMNMTKAIIIYVNKL